MTEYKSYHTNLVLLYKFNSLPDEFRSIVPKSTLSGWNNRNVAKIIGCDSLADNIDHPWKMIRWIDWWQRLLTNTNYKWKLKYDRGH